LGRLQVFTKKPSCKTRQDGLCNNDFRQLKTLIETSLILTMQVQCFWLFYKTDREGHNLTGQTTAVMFVSICHVCVKANGAKPQSVHDLKWTAALICDE